MAFHVRRATPHDSALVDDVLRAAVDPDAPRSREPRPEALRALLEDPRAELHLALSPREPGRDDEGTEEAVGVVVLRHGMSLLPAVAPVLHVEQLWVAPAWRRRGVGHQLLAAAAASATAAGAEEVWAVAAPGERDAQRFLARLGFAHPVVHRVAPLALLRARLAAATASAPALGARRRAALEQLLARRRRQLSGGARIPSQVSPSERPAAGT
ncbi:GNAT family N-acetyltransferase [Quadrisphaera granulorum]|nr:GNAT family N-acetyltransferase [Quadrisphaera granulorum]